MKNTSGEGRRRRPRRRANRRPAPGLPEAAAGGGKTTASAIQLAIGLLTASLDSPELEAWAVHTLILEDPGAIGDFLAGLHILSQLLLHELHAATGQPAAATLQRLALLAETGRGTPSTG